MTLQPAADQILAPSLAATIRRGQRLKGAGSAPVMRSFGTSATMERYVSIDRR